MERCKYGERNQTNVGILGWASIACAVVAFDGMAEETLSHAFKRGLDNPKYRPVVLGALAITNLHLLGLLPRPIDPFNHIESLFK